MQPEPDSAEIVWRLADNTDISAVADLAKASFDPFYQERWTDRQMADLLRDQQSWLDVAIHPHAGPVAFSLCRQIVDEVELLLCASHPDWRQQGLGQEMMRRVLSACKDRGARSVFLEVRAGNDPAIALYQAFGFTETGRRPNYYQTLAGDHLDAITMARSL